MSALALLGAFATLLFAGYGLLALLVRQETRFSLTEQIAFSWLLGTGRFHCFSGFLVFFSMGCCYVVLLASFAFRWDSSVGDEWCRYRLGALRSPSKFFSV